jgi:tRNA threonylcarbamoyladenosine biosynthesis protein TsaB
LVSGAEKPLLAIDTSTGVAGIALYGPGGPLAEASWAAGRAQTATVLREIERLCTLSGLRPDDLGAVAVATGPGSFNGMRVGISTAKGLVFALGLPLLGVPTLDATAYPHGDAGTPVRAVLVAGRGRYVSALYRWQEGAQRRMGDYENGTLAELAGLIVEPTLVCGELPHERLAEWRATAPLARVVPPTLNARRASCLAEIAWQRHHRGETDDTATLEPVYLHGGRVASNE